MESYPKQCTTTEEADGILREKEMDLLALVEHLVCYRAWTVTNQTCTKELVTWEGQVMFT